MATRPRALVIGFDGATFDLLDPLVATGHLPTVSRLLRNGVRARLMSTIPPATVPAWPTFMTGKSPGRHGVFDFFVRDTTGSRRLVSSRDINGPTLWRHLSNHGRRSIVLNVPCTYPPEPIDGVMVSGMLTPLGGQYVMPPEMAAQLDAWTGGYRVNPHSGYLRSPFDRNELIRELQEVSNIQKRAFHRLLKTQDWDFAMLMFRATDIIQHKLWHRFDDIARMYEFMDSALAEIVAVAGDASIWLISDHGFGPLEKLFYINRWLQDQGWLRVRRRKAASVQKETSVRMGQDERRSTVALRSRLAQAGLSRDRARAILPNSIHSLLRRLFPVHFRRLLPVSSYEVDWSHTQVFSDSAFTQETQALRINLRGRESAGQVDPAQYEALRAQVTQALKELRDPRTGQPVVADVYNGGELFAGPYVDRAPDLVLQLNDGYKMIGDFAAKEVISRSPQVGGCHRRDGIFVAAGSGIAAGLDLGELTIADVMPTLLHYMGITVPADCDGRVQPDLFVPGSEPACRAVAYEDTTTTKQPGGGELESDDEEVLARLRALGYIG